MWQIELEAPQYPEGLVLKLHANKIGGDVEIINGLNHYIGMATCIPKTFSSSLFCLYFWRFCSNFFVANFYCQKKSSFNLLYFLYTFCSFSSNRFLQMEL
jgi:copper chaperone NosL